MKTIEIQEALETAKGIAWDTCHKIYILMDDEQMTLMNSYGYRPLISSAEMGPDEMLTTIENWYENSCGLRFVESVSTEGGFTSLIEQFENENEKENA